VESLQNGKLVKWQVDEMVRHQIADIGAKGQSKTENLQILNFC
jgi:hypothetical protein